MKKTARAHTNIALVKYWGKKDQELIIPMNSSLSLTLDHFYTDTSVEFKEELTGPEYAQRFIDQAEELEIGYRLNTMVMDILDMTTENPKEMETGGLRCLQQAKSSWVP